MRIHWFTRCCISIHCLTHTLSHHCCSLTIHHFLVWWHYSHPLAHNLSSLIIHHGWCTRLHHLIVSSKHWIPIHGLSYSCSTIHHVDVCISSSVHQLALAEVCISVGCHIRMLLRNGRRILLLKFNRIRHPVHPASLKGLSTVILYFALSVGTAEFVDFASIQTWSAKSVRVR